MKSLCCILALLCALYVSRGQAQLEDEKALASIFSILAGLGHEPTVFQKAAELASSDSVKKNLDYQFGEFNYQRVVGEAERAYGQSRTQAEIKRGNSLRNAYWLRDQGRIPEFMGALQIAEANYRAELEQAEQQYWALISSVISPVYQYHN